MSVKSGSAITVIFTTQNPTTGAAADASSTPVGTLYVNGTANGATVTVTNLTVGLYKAALTLPSLTAGDVVSLRIAATVATVAGEGVVWQEVADTAYVSEVSAQVASIGSPPTAATIADAVLDEAVAGHTGFLTTLSTAAALAVVDTNVDAIKAVTDAIDLGDTIINMQETVVGGDVTVKAGDTWRFTLTDADLDMSAYEVLAFVVKASDRQAEAQAQLYVRSDTGLQRVNGDAPVAAGNGTLTKDSATAFTVVVHMAETISVNPGFWYWWIKGIDTTPTPDEGTTLASGRFTVTHPGVQAVS